MALTAKEEETLRAKEAEGYDTSKQRAWLEAGRPGEMPPPRKRAEGNPRAHRTFAQEPADAILAAINEGKQANEERYGQSLTNNTVTRGVRGAAGYLADAASTVGSAGGELLSHPGSALQQGAVGAFEGMGMDVSEIPANYPPEVRAQILAEREQIGAEAPESRNAGRIASQAYVGSKLGAIAGPLFGAAAEGAALPGVAARTGARVAAGAGTGATVGGGAAALTGGDVGEGISQGAIVGGITGATATPARRAAGMLAEKIRGGTGAASADVRALEAVGGRPSPRPFKPAVGGAFEDEIPEAAKAYGQGDAGTGFREYIGNKAAQGVLGDQQRQVDIAKGRLRLRKAAEGVTGPEGPAAEQIGYQGEGSKRVDMSEVLDAARAAGARSENPAFFEGLENRIAGRPGIDMGGGVQIRRPVQPRVPGQGQMDIQNVADDGIRRYGAGGTTPVWNPSGAAPRTASAQAEGRPTMTVRDAHALLKDIDAQVKYESGQRSLAPDQIPAHGVASTLRRQIYSPNVAPRLAAANKSYAGVKGATQDMLRQFGYEDPAIEEILRGEVTAKTANQLGSAITSYGTKGNSIEAVEYLRDLHPAYRHAIDLARAQLAADNLSVTSVSPGALKDPLTARVAYPAAKAAAKPRPAGAGALMEAAEAERARKKKR